MKWKNRTYNTYTEIIDAVLKMNKAEQTAFVKAYAKTGPYALQNIGYFSGYYDKKTAKKIMGVFKTSHPIFGTEFPNQKDAFEMGKKMASYS